MKTSRPSRTHGSLALLALVASLVAPFAVAGPGSQFWTAPGPAPSAPSPSKTPAAPNVTAKSPSIAAAMAACSGCSDAMVVEKTVVRDQWNNGRGPKRVDVVGADKVCESCLPAMTVMKPSWSNGRGPLHAVSLPVTHVCQPLSAVASR